MQTVNCFLPYVSPAMVKLTVDELRSTGLVNKIYLLASDSLQAEACDGCEILQVDTLTGTNTLRTIWEHADERNVLFYTGTTPLRFGQNGLERMLFVAENRCCKIVYADHYKICNGIRQEHPLNDYQEGSIRDDFDFGPLLLLNYDELNYYFESRKKMFPEYVYAGFYLYQLNASFMPETIVHIREYLYSFTEEDNRKSGEKQFDYVDPKNREVQEEMESACTVYLKYLGAFLKKKPLKVKFKKEGFPCEASVIIPVRNRVRTIGDAIRSVFRQQTNFDFNLIIVDNYSTDGTTEVIQQ